MQNMGDWIKRLMDRLKDLIFKPREAWERIAGEEGTVQTLLKEYLLILAAIPAIASFLGRWIVGEQLPFRSARAVVSWPGKSWTTSAWPGARRRSTKASSLVPA